MLIVSTLTDNPTDLIILSFTVSFNVIMIILQFYSTSIHIDTNLVILRVLVLLLALA